MYINRLIIVIIIIIMIIMIMIMIIIIIIIIIIIVIIYECAYTINGNILHFLLTGVFSHVNSIRSLYTLKGH